jgi:type II secretory pathway component GspD/PulD (secretin)
MKRQKQSIIDSIFFSLFFITCLLSVILPATLTPVFAEETDSLAPVLAEETDSETVEPATIEIFKVRQRLAKELLPEVHTVLSPAGRASADTITNSIIVFDTPDHIEQIRKLIQTLDRQVPQVTVILRYHQTATKSRSLSTSGGVSGHSGGLRMSSGTFNREKNLQLTISSGSSGFLMVGRNIPFTSYWLDLCSRYGYRFGWLTEYKTVGSGFEVRPVVLGKKVDLTLVPRLSFADRREIRFTEAATRVTVPINTWVRIAATDSGMDTVSAAIMTANGQTNNRAMVLEVMARVR